MEKPGWKDLPSELLLKVASFCVKPNALKVCHAWKTGLETVTTQLIIRESDLPLNLASRFQSLTSLDLHHFGGPFGRPGEYNITAQGLEALRDLPQLSSLALLVQQAAFTKEAS